MSPPNPNASPMIWLRHQDPQRLWVKIALISVVVHGLLLWLGFPILMRTQSAVTASEEAVVVPIELVDSPIPPQPAATEGSDSSAIASEISPTPPTPQSQSSEVQSFQPNQGTTAPLSNGSSAANTAPANAGNTAPSNTGQAGTSVNPGAPAPNGGNAGSPNRNNREGTADNSSTQPGTNVPNRSGTDNPPPTSGQSGNPETTGNPSNPDNLAVWVHLSHGATPTDETDIPPQLPTLLDPSPRRINLTPGTAICSVANPAIITQYSQSGLTVSLRLTVEDNGQVSNVSVYQSSDNQTFDEFARCLVRQQGLQFNPAQDGGHAVPTTLMILNVSLSPG
ncbi:MAG: TonB family protein [Cyanobacteria bacterium P01_A01_bin.123]